MIYTIIFSVSLKTRKVLAFNMASIKYLHCSKVCVTTHGMTKHLSTYKSILYHSIPRQIQHQITDSLVILKAEATVLLIE